MGAGLVTVDSWSTALLFVRLSPSWTPMVSSLLSSFFSASPFMPLWNKIGNDSDLFGECSAIACAKIDPRDVSVASIPPDDNR